MAGKVGVNLFFVCRSLPAVRLLEKLAVTGDRNAGCCGLCSVFRTTLGSCLDNRLLGKLDVRAKAVNVSERLFGRIDGPSSQVATASDDRFRAQSKEPGEDEFS